MARNGMTKLPKRLISVPPRRTQIGGGRARSWSRKVDILSGAKDLTMQSVAESEPLTRPSATFSPLARGEGLSSALTASALLPCVSGGEGAAKRRMRGTDAHPEILRRLRGSG